MLVGIGWSVDRLSVIMMYCADNVYTMDRQSDDIDYECTGCSKKTGPLDYFDDNFGKYGLILTIFSLLQRENYGAQNLSHFSHLTFIMLPLYLAKQTLMLVSCHYYVVIVFVYNFTF